MLRFLIASPPPQPVISRREGVEWTLLAGAGIAAVGVFGFIRNVSKLSPDPVLSKMSRFRYNNNGRLFLQQKNTSWMGVVNDLKNPGRLLLRNEYGDLFYWDLYLSDNIQQVDLTNSDLIMEMLATHPDWEERLIPLPLYPMYQGFKASDTEFRKGVRYSREDDRYFWVPELANTELRQALTSAANNGFQIP
eukprot:TRINITY_DN9_c45_g1_i2.p1 TRINITY_DN9_c45_g1~~TRINITY_DN9_c45_g1_i2.p1  ORF type:complete len:192 (+),score=18.52 TRINITY_DN9_c45_g1_i2:101-676(+)